MAFGEPRPFMTLSDVSVAATLTPPAPAVGGWCGGILPPGNINVGGGYWDGYNWYWLTPPPPVRIVTVSHTDPALTGEVRALREEVVALREELARKRKKKEG